MNNAFEEDGKFKDISAKFQKELPQRKQELIDKFEFEEDDLGRDKPDNTHEDFSENSANSYDSY